MNDQPRSNDKRKKFRAEFSSTGLFFGLLGFIFVLGWIFVLGVMVGRGFVPEGVRALGQMTEQLTRLVTILGSDRDTRPATGPEQQATLEFYDQLGRAPTEATTERKRGKIPPAPASTAPPAVSQTAAPPAPSDTAPPLVEEAEKSGWVVQVASLDSEPKALRMTENLRDLGYPAYTYKTFVRGIAFHRVRCGPFDNRADAETTKRLLGESQGIEAFITMVEN